MCLKGVFAGDVSEGCVLGMCLRGVDLGLYVQCGLTNNLLMSLVVVHRSHRHRGPGEEHAGAQGHGG